MVEVKPAGFYFTIFGIFCAVIVVILNFRLMIKLFRSDAFRNKHEYKFFAYRFCADFWMNLTVVLYFIGMCLFFTNSTALTYHPLFYVALLCSNLNATRGILALCIAIERTCAAYFPINFHNYRLRFPSLLVAVAALLFGLFEDVMLYHFCQFTYIERPACSAFGCATNGCFLRYWGVNKSIISGTTALLSLLLFIKLLCFRFCSDHRTTDLTRANQLCLVDTVTVLIFDFSPYIFTLILGDQVIYLEGYGPYNAVLKVIACVIDSSIATLVIGKVTKTEKRRHNMTVTSSAKKSSGHANAKHIES